LATLRLSSDDGGAARRLIAAVIDVPRFVKLRYTVPRGKKRRTSGRIQGFSVLSKLRTRLRERVMDG